MTEKQTAEDIFFKNAGKTINQEEYSAMIEFAKLHVEAALKEASENAKAHIDHNGEWVSTNVKSRVNKDSIINSYPLENIK